MHFHSFSINKVDQEKEASLESGHVFKDLAKEKVSLVNGMCGFTP